MLEKNLNNETLENQITLFNDVCKAYADEHKTIIVIAREYHLTYHTVRKILIDNNIKLRPKNSK